MRIGVEGQFVWEIEEAYLQCAIKGNILVKKKDGQSKYLNFYTDEAAALVVKSLTEKGFYYAKKEEYDPKVRQNR